MSKFKGIFIERQYLERLLPYSRLYTEVILPIAWQHRLTKGPISPGNCETVIAAIEAYELDYWKHLQAVPVIRYGLLYCTYEFLGYCTANRRRRDVRIIALSYTLLVETFQHWKSFDHTEHCWD